MPKPEKVQATAEIKERLENARAVFLAEYSGLSVQEQQALRRGLRARGAEFKVVKMTLARRAAADLGIDSLDDLLLGPTGLAYADEDAVAAAKTLRDFAADHEAFTIKGGLLGREFLTPERIGELAAIESREVLLANLLGLTRAPLRDLISLTTAVVQNTATLFQRLYEKRAGESTAAGEGESPAGEALSEAETAGAGESADAAPGQDDDPDGAGKEVEAPEVATSETQDTANEPADKE